MSIGKAVHSLFGEPSGQVQEQMRGIGNYFQEASYTVRDFHRGNLLDGAGFKFLENTSHVDDSTEGSDELEIIEECEVEA